MLCQELYFFDSAAESGPPLSSIVFTGVGLVVDMCSFRDSKRWSADDNKTGHLCNIGKTEVRHSRVENGWKVLQIFNATRTLDGVVHTTMPPFSGGAVTFGLASTSTREVSGFCEERPVNKQILL